MSDGIINDPLKFDVQKTTLAIMVSKTIVVTGKTKSSLYRMFTRATSRQNEPPWLAYISINKVPYKGTLRISLSLSTS